MSTRRNFLMQVGAGAATARVAALGAAVVAGAAQAQSNKAITIVAGFPPGGGPDLVARALAERGRRELGQPIVVDNKTGAGGRIALDWLRHQPADGGAFCLTPSAMLTSYQHVYKKLSYSQSDFDPVCKVCTYHMSVVTRADAPFSTLPEFVAWARANKRGTFGVPSIGSATDFSGHMLARAENLALEPILYRGGPQLTQAVLSGEIDIAINLSSNFIELAKAGRLKVLAVTAAKRTQFAPQIPTLAELGYRDLVFEEFIGIVAKKGTPQKAVQRMQDAMQKSLEDQGVRNALMGLEYRPDFKPAEQLVGEMAAASGRYKAIVQKLNFEPLD